MNEAACVERQDLPWFLDPVPDAVVQVCDSCSAKVPCFLDAVADPSAVGTRAGIGEAEMNRRRAKMGRRKNG
jgi:hypothetical protein